MQSQLYPAIRQDFLTGQFDWTAAYPRAILLPQGYSPDFTNQYLASIPLGVRIATSEDVDNSPVANGGVASCAPIRFPLLFDNRMVTQAVVFDDTGDENTSRLVFFIGADDLVSSPFIPVGFDYFIYPNVVQGGFFRI